MIKNFFINLQRQNMYAAQAAAFGQRFLCHFRWSKHTASRGVLVTAPKVSIHDLDSA